MGVLSDNAIIGASNPSGYVIPYSMRMPDYAAGGRLYRTLTSAGSSNPKWTFATWFKKGSPTTSVKCLYTFQCKSIHANGSVHVGWQNDTINYGGGIRMNNWSGAVSQSDWDTDNNAGTNEGMAFRDYTDWFHICHIVDYSTSPYVFLYMNGVLMNPSTIYGYKFGPGYGTNYAPLTGNIFRVASDAGTSGNGYLADTYFIEGQNLPPIGNFLEVDDLTNETKAIEYAGTYTGNSFYFDYADSSDFGKDVSGLDNHFTTTSIPATNQVIDTPQNTVGSNFCTWNGANTTPGCTLSKGNLGASVANSADCTLGTFSVSSGKWYWESLSTSTNNFCGAVADPTVNSMLTSTGLLNRATAWAIRSEGVKQNGTTGDEAYGDSFTNGDIIGTALDMDNEKIWWSKNGVWQASGDPAAGTNPAYSGVFTSQGVVNGLAPGHGQYSGTVSVTANFGQDSSFAGAKTAQGNSDGGGKGDFYYTPPSGYLALCEDNLSTPSIKLPEAHYKTKLYAGTGSAQTITGVGFKPDSTWIHDRSQGNNWVIQPVTTPTKFFISNGASGEQANTDFLNAFAADGFTLGTNSAVNYNGDYFASFNWLGGDGASNNTDGTVTSSVSANPTAGFSVVTFTGTGSALTVGHGLSQAPDYIIAKSSAASTNWPMYGAASTGPTNIMYFNLSNNLGTDAQSFTSISASTIGIGTTTDLNQNATQCTLWCFHSVPGYSKFGKAILMGSSPSGNSGTYIYLGFKPAFFYWKMTGASHAGTIYDRQLTNDKADPAPHNVGNVYLVPSANYADQKSINPMIGWDYLSNGVKQRQDYSVNTMQYMAFAYKPEKYSRGG